MASFAFEEEQIKTKVHFGVWGKIIGYALRRWYLLAILAITMLLTSFHDASFVPLLNKAAIEAIRLSQGLPFDAVVIDVQFIFGIRFTVDFWGYGLTLLIGILLRSLCIFITFFATNYLEMSIYVDIRQDGFRRVQELSFSYFDKTSAGWLIARLQSDTSKIADMISWGIIRVVWLVFDLVLTLITMFTVSWQMALILLAASPLIMIIAPYFEMVLLKLSRIARNAFSGYVAWLAESIAGAKTIKTLAIETTVQAEADEIVTDIRNKNFKRTKFQALFHPSVVFVMSLTTAIVIFFGSMFMKTDTTITVATFALYIGFVRAIFNPLQEFAELFGDIVQTQSSVEKIVSLIDTKPQIVDRPDVIAKYGTLFHERKENYEPIKGDIEFKNVNFSYLKDIEIIHDMNLKIKAGQSIAIVGETGSGKSTTVNLLCRFYEPTSGQLLIDGVDYRERSVSWLRSNIGYVQQSPFIFSGTIRKNIAYGKLDATDEEIIHAAKLVDVHDFIMSLPNGYNTELQDGGSELSVGQKQLISFARAIVRDPVIMILDEATSSIDTETEVVIQKAIKDVLKGRTSIIIAHRLSTIVDSDRILVMSNGKIIEDGTHRELITAQGTYHHLYMNQFAELKVEEQIETYETQIAGIVD
ncbi:MAG TPA: ABC transporter ATP-binding protein [Firmicutes bacterium]|nr:ABC transporter ATP-binding protein [Bacillota bacterium]HAV19450.1 ABC transporter ATP-binding protein [Bacillota bacterium]